MTGAGKRPKNHDGGKTAARAQRIGQFAASHIHECIGKQESGLEIGELKVRERDFLLYGVDGDGKRLAIQIADGNGSAYKNCDSPAQQQFSPWISQAVQVKREHFCARAELYSAKWKFFANQIVVGLAGLSNA
jgi:hypothetical protein